MVIPARYVTIFNSDLQKNTTDKNVVNSVFFTTCFGLVDRPPSGSNVAYKKRISYILIIFFLNIKIESKYCFHDELEKHDWRST